MVLHIRYGSSDEQGAPIPPFLLGVGGGEADLVLNHSRSLLPEEPES